MNLKRVFILLFAIMLLTACALAEDYEPAAAAAEWSAEDLNGTWNIFYRIDDGVGSSTKDSVFQISMVIDGESLVHTFSYGDGEDVSNATVEYTGDNAILTYEDGMAADATLLEDGTLQWHMEPTADTPECFMFFEKADSEAE